MGIFFFGGALGLGLGPALFDIKVLVEFFKTQTLPMLL